MPETCAKKYLPAIATLLAAASCAYATLPPYTLTRVYKSGDLVVGTGIVNSPFNSGLYGGSGLLGLAVNNSGLAFVHVGLNQAPPSTTSPVPGIFDNYNHAVLQTNTGLNPLLVGGAEFDGFDYPPGSVSVPTSNFVYDQSFWTSVNNNGVGALDLRLGSASFASETPVTGVYFNNTAMPIREGDVITAAGVSPGTVFGPLGPDRTARYRDGSPLTSAVAINDSNVILFAGIIVESGLSKRAILKVACDASGVVTSQTLVAKEGGAIPGGGGATWTTIATTPNTVAINNNGQVVFSGLSSSGASGIFLTTTTGGSFVAQTGGAAPGGGTWNSLLGVPVDVNNGGQFAFRGVVLGGGGNGGTWTEIGPSGEAGGDAGETFATFLSYTANGTTGGGPLATIGGILSTDNDVDVYYIRVGDPALQTQQPFTATTVPDPGSGFVGASFDTVLYLFADNQNCNGNTRVGVGRCDDAGPGVEQSTLTSASLRSGHVPGTSYFLAISSGKSRAQSRGIDAWQMVPSRIVYSATTGLVYWIEPGSRSLMRADGATGTMLAPVSIGPVPTQSSGGQPAGIDAPLLDAKIALYDAGASSKLLFQRKGWNAATFQTCDLDGSNVQNLTITGFSPFNTSFAIDSANGKLYWSRPSTVQTAIYRCNMDGSGGETVVAPVDVCDCDLYSVDAMAIDTLGTGRLYWFESLSNRIVYEELSDLPDLSAAHLHQVATGVSVTAMTIDSAARRLYYTSSSNGTVRAIDLTSNTLLPAIVTTTRPEGVALDGAGMVYWTNPLDRYVRRSAIALPSVQDWLFVGRDTGERPTDGPNHMDCVVNGWARNGAAGATPLPYQIKLTGASFYNQAAMICRNNTTKIAMGGESLPATGNRTLNAVGSLTGPVRISDRGLVAWRGEWFTSGNALRRGLFLGTDKLFDGTAVPSNASTAAGDVDAGSAGFDLSTSGQYAIASCFNGSFGGGGNNSVMLAFDSVPGCKPDFNGDGILSVQDIFDFLNAWFAGSLASDYNGDATLGVQDIFDFLNGWFAGC